MEKKVKKCTRKPANSEHIQHAEIIKKCHLKLRLDSMQMGADEAWKKHCLDESLLKVNKFFFVLQKFFLFLDFN